MGKILVAGERLNLGVRGPGEMPSWERQDQVALGVATLDRSPGSPWGEAHIPQSLRTEGTRRGGPRGWSTDQVEPALHTLEWIFFQTCLQRLSLTVG